MFARITPVVKNLLIVNIALWAIQLIIQIDLNHIFGLRYIFADEFQPFQFITYMFFHQTYDVYGNVSFAHILGNMFALFIFGPMLERFWGGKRFFIFYMVTGVGAGILYSAVHFIEINQMLSDANQYFSSLDYEDFVAFFGTHLPNAINNPEYYKFIEHYGDNPDNQQVIDQAITEVQAASSLLENGLMVGASGAVFGILFAFGYLFPNTQLMLLIPPIPIKAKYLVTFYGLYELYAGIQRAPGDNVAHWAHLGGMLIAFILLKIWQDNRNNFY